MKSQKTLLLKKRDVSEASAKEKECYYSEQQAHYWTDSCQHEPKVEDTTQGKCDPDPYTE